MAKGIKERFDDFLHLLLAGTQFKYLGADSDVVRIELPLLDRSNDFIYIYCKKLNGRYIFGAGNGTTIDVAKELDCQEVVNPFTDCSPIVNDGFAAGLLTAIIAELADMAKPESCKMLSK